MPYFSQAGLILALVSVNRVSSYNLTEQMDLRDSFSDILQIHLDKLH